LIDATTNEQIAIIPSVEYALKIAHQRAGALWQEEVDPRRQAGVDSADVSSVSRQCGFGTPSSD